VTVIGDPHFLGFLDPQTRGIPTARRPRAIPARARDEVAL
jgi:hypothetical protein